MLQRDREVARSAFCGYLAMFAAPSMRDAKGVRAGEWVGDLLSRTSRAPSLSRAAPIYTPGQGKQIEEPERKAMTVNAVSQAGNARATSAAATGHAEEECLGRRRRAGDMAPTSYSAW